MTCSWETPISDCVGLGVFDKTPMIAVYVSVFRRHGLMECSARGVLPIVPTTTGVW